MQTSCCSHTRPHLLTLASLYRDRSRHQSSTTTTSHEHTSWSPVSPGSYTDKVSGSVKPQRRKHSVDDRDQTFAQDWFDGTVLLLSFDCLIVHIHVLTCVHTHWTCDSFKRPLSFFNTNPQCVGQFTTLGHLTPQKVSHSVLWSVFTLTGDT